MATRKAKGPKRKPPPRLREAKATIGKRCFTAEDEALFERGFPNLHVLTDELVPPKQAIKTARLALDAIDPRLPVFVPRDVARRFVLGFLTGRTWGHGPKAHVVEVPERTAAREAALASSRDLDAALFEQFLETHCPTAPEWRVTVDDVSVAGTDVETYGWRLHEVVHVFEQVLGTEHVARRLGAALLRALHDREAWGFWGKDPFRHNASAHHLAFAFATLRWRLDPKLWQELVEPFRDAESEPLLVYADLLACLADDARVPKSPSYVAELALHRRDTQILETALEGEAIFWRSELPWLLGGAPYAKTRLGRVRRLPDWKQVRFVDEVGRLAIPEVAMAIGMLATSRPAKRAATEWLNAHAEVARPALTRAIAERPDDDDRERARLALDLMEAGVAVPEPSVLDEDQLVAAMRLLFGALERQLISCKGHVEQERVVMRAAFDRYCETRAAAGEVMPEAYFGHQMIEWRAPDAKAMERWMELATAVADE